MDIHEYERRYNVRALAILAEERERLCAFTARCRPDMHEPDEQAISAVVHGSKLDNADGAHVHPDKPDWQEIVVELRHETEWDDETGEPTKWDSEYFNLATLIAMAREPRSE